MELENYDSKKAHEEALDLISPNRFKFSKAAVLVIRWFIFLSVVFFILGFLLSFFSECPLVDQECSLVNIAVAATISSVGVVGFFSVSSFIKRIVTQNWD